MAQEITKDNALDELQKIARMDKGFTAEKYGSIFDKIAKSPGLTLEYDNIQAKIKGLETLLNNVKMLIESKLKKEDDIRLYHDLIGPWYSRNKVSLLQFINFYNELTASEKLNMNRKRALEIQQTESMKKTNLSLTSKNHINHTVENALKRIANQKSRNAEEARRRRAEAEEAKRLNIERLNAERRKAEEAKFLKAEAEEAKAAAEAAEAAKAAAKEAARLEEEARVEKIFEGGKSRRKSASKRSTRSKSKRHVRKTRK